jgi:hypothetical protein
VHDPISSERPSLPSSLSYTGHRMIVNRSGIKYRSKRRLVPQLGSDESCSTWRTEEHEAREKTAALFLLPLPFRSYSILCKIDTMLGHVGVYKYNAHEQTKKGPYQHSHDFGRKGQDEA